MTKLNVDFVKIILNRELCYFNNEPINLKESLEPSEIKNQMAMTFMMKSKNIFQLKFDR